MNSKHIYTAEKYAEDVKDLLASHSPVVVTPSASSSSGGASSSSMSAVYDDESLYD